MWSTQKNNYLIELTNMKVHLKQNRNCSNSKFCPPSYPPPSPVPPQLNSAGVIPKALRGHPRYLSFKILPGNVALGEKVAPGVREVEAATRRMPSTTAMSHTSAAHVRWLCYWMCFSLCFVRFVCVVFFLYFFLFGCGACVVLAWA